MVSRCTYRFLSDDDSVEVMKKSDILFVLRGLPGSGKSYLANEIRKIYPNTKTCSADDFFINEQGVYQFDQNKLEAAHHKCEEDAVDYMIQRIPHIIIDNTNIRRSFVYKYIRLAKKHGYIAVIVGANSPWSSDPTELAQRNSHGLTVAQLGKKLKSFQEIYPMYWGWFFSDADFYQGMSLTELAEKCFQLCMANLPEFQIYIKSRFEGADDFSAVYTHGQPLKQRRALHCTSFYAGPNGKDNPAVQEYQNNTAVTQSLLKAFTLNVSGIMLTSRTAGARVVLTESQMALWGNDTVNLNASNRTQRAEKTESAEKIECEIECETTSRKAKKKSKSTPQNKIESAEKIECEIECETTSRKAKKKSKVNRKNKKGKSIDSERSDLGDDSDSFNSDLFNETSTGTVESLLASTKTLSIADDTCNDNEFGRIENSCINGNGSPELVEENKCLPDDNTILDGNSADKEGMNAKPRLENMQQLSTSSLPTGARAHVTLACSRGVKPVQTGIDQLDILQCEEDGEIVGSKVKVDTFEIIYYGEGRCSVTFESLIPIKCIFNGM